MSRNLILSAALAMAMALPVHAADQQPSDLDTVVATVGEVDITLGHMLTARANLPQQYQQLPNDMLWDGLLDQLIQQEVLAQDPLAKETRRVRLAMDNEKRALMATESVTAVAEAAVTEEALQAEYAATYLNAPEQLEYNASHILVDTEEEAAQLSRELRGGGNFAAVAREKSTGPSGPNGGSLGWFSKGMMVEPFQAAVEGLRDGEVSAPVQTQFGWHVIKLNETRSKEVPSLDEVRGELTESLQQQAVSQHITALMGRTEITQTDKTQIDLSVLSNFGLLED